MKSTYFAVILWNPFSGHAEERRAVEFKADSDMESLVLSNQAVNDMARSGGLVKSFLEYGKFYDDSIHSVTVYKLEDSGTAVNLGFTYVNHLRCWQENFMSDRINPEDLSKEESR